MILTPSFGSTLTLKIPCSTKPAPLFCGFFVRTRQHLSLIHIEMCIRDSPDSWITRAAGIQTAAAFACDGQAGITGGIGRGQHIDPLADLCDCIGALQCDCQLRSAVLIVHANGSASDKRVGHRRHALFNCGIVQGQNIVLCVIMAIVVRGLRCACTCDQMCIRDRVDSCPT